jgi:hypothetical protein
MRKHIFTIILLMPVFMLGQIAPAVPAIIGGAASLIGGLFGAKAAAEEKKRQRVFEAQQLAFQTEAQSAQQLGQGQQTAFQQLMEGYRSALL